MVHPSKDLPRTATCLKGYSPVPPVCRPPSQLPRLPSWVLVPGQTEPPAELQLDTLLWRVRPGLEPLTGHPRSHWQHGQLHQRRRGPGSGLQGARRKHVHQPTGNHPGHGTAAEQGRGAFSLFKLLCWQTTKPIWWRDTWNPGSLCSPVWITKQ